MIRVNLRKFHPLQVWLLVLVIVFLTEYGVMLVLPCVLPGQPSRLSEATVDAVTLTAVLAPVIWWTAVRPLQEVIRLRARFLTDLFTQIEADRRRTAHELHDGIGQSLSLLVSGLRSAYEALAGGESAGRCHHLLELATVALKDVKRMALGLRPSLLDDLGLAPAVERLVQDVRDHNGVEVSLNVAGVVGIRLDESVETAVFRIVQEAMANVVTHAAARSAMVAIDRRNGTVTVEVSDDGCGFEPQGSGRGAGHLGLVGMQERATLLGGQFSISSAPGRGTRIKATIPAGGKCDG